jgi:hypothetical protein
MNILGVPKYTVNRAQESKEEEELDGALGEEEEGREERKVICMLKRERRLELVNFDQMTSKFV